ncbi:MAG: hypothetical protein L3J33_04380, partial [Rhodobacteraceae bacterium]|nr:hypothetical protein [Paracoccaceae bacterium]
MSFAPSGLQTIPRIVCLTALTLRVFLQQRNRAGENAAFYSNAVQIVAFIGCCISKDTAVVVGDFASVGAYVYMTVLSVRWRQAVFFDRPLPVLKSSKPDAKSPKVSGKRKYTPQALIRPDSSARWV